MPPSRSLYYLRFVFLVVSARLSSRHAINKLDDSPQHRIISCNAKQLNVQLERLMFCKDVYVVPCDITPSHFTQRYTVCMYAVPFYIMLSHFTQRYTICVYAVPFDITWPMSRNATLFVCTLYHSTFRWAISRNATPFVCTLYHSTLRWANWRNAYRLCVRCATRHYPEPFHATVRRLNG